jgi:NAD+ kinase
MKYTLINRGDAQSTALTEQFHQLAAAKGLQVDDDNPEVVVTIGGDGTLLQAYHKFNNELHQVAFVGIHTGHLGFYADWNPDEIETLVELMANPSSPRHNVEYPLIEMTVESEEGKETFLAMNETTVKCLEGTLVIQIDINNKPFEMFRGDGLCISTPSGSTGYNKSLNGAILHPSIEAIQLAEMASINNRVYRTLGSSLVLPKHHHLSLYPKGQRNQCILFTLDHLSFRREKVTAIHCTVAQTKMRFVRFRPFPFWTRVREAFIAMDPQDEGPRNQ